MSPERRPPLERAERLLADRGRDFASGRVRVAVGRSGVAVGFPRDPLIHLSWWALATVGALYAFRRRRRA
jgi:hypothetical protein